MTNKQYEHLGRAVVAEARLEDASAALDGMRSVLCEELAKVTTEEVAEAYVRTAFGKWFANLSNGNLFLDVVRQIVEAEGKVAK